MVDDMIFSVQDAMKEIKKVYDSKGKVSVEFITEYLIRLKDRDNDKHITLARRNLLLQMLTLDYDIITYEQFKVLNDFIYGMFKNW